MPPASLPAIPAMSPGPMTARNASRPRRPRNRPRSRTQTTRRDPLAEAAQIGAHRATAASPATLRGDTRRRQLAGRIVSMASSTVTIPTRWRSASSVTGHGQQVVAGDDTRDVVVVGVDADRDRLVDHDLAIVRLGPGHDQVAQRQHADEVRRRRRRRRRSRSSRRRARARAAGRSSGRPSGARGPRRTRSSSSRRPCPPGRRAGRPARPPRRVSMSASSSSRVSSDRSATRSAASSGDISSRMSAARSGARPSRTSTCVSGSISSMASAAASSSSAARTPARSRGASWSMIVARSAGCSSVRPACGTRSLIDATLVSTGSTSSQSM